MIILAFLSIVFIVLTVVKDRRDYFNYYGRK